jgi:tetratricopeptide (TPR) repeat protein
MGEPPQAAPATPGAGRSGQPSGGGAPRGGLPRGGPAQAAYVERSAARAGAAGGRQTGGPRGGATREEIAQREYDPRREERRKATRVALPDDVDPRMLDADARRELRSLSKDTSDLVARHLVATGQLLDEDPGQALAHARAARALAGRVAVVREAAGLAAYAAGEWAEALSELRAARRISGRPEHLGVFADCERALGRPERALAYADDPQVAQLSQDQRVELVIVLAGARRDMGQADAAVLTLQDPARRTSEKRPWAARLWYAYADALLDAGREEQAREWFVQAADVDVHGETDAGDRLLALDGVVLEDPEEEAVEVRGDLPDEAELAELVRDIPAAGAGEPAAGAGEPAAGAVPTAAPSAPAAAEHAAPADPPSPVSGVNAPMFVAPPDAPGQDADDDEDLRLFD